MELLKSYQDINRILVFNPSYIGDAILTTPLMTAVGKVFPGARVDFCVRPESAPLFSGLYNTVVFDKRRSSKGIRGIADFAGVIKDNGYDLVFCVHKSFRSVAAMRLSKVKTVGFKEAALSFLLGCTVHRDMRLHEAERDLSLLSCVTDGFSLQEAKKLGGGLKTYLDADFYTRCTHEFKHRFGQKKIVAVNAGSTWATKRWPVEYFAETVRKLSASYGIVILGGPQDEPVNGVLRKLLDESSISYADYGNKVEFSKIPAVVKATDLLITNDSAPMHIAVSQQVQCVALFGATTPSLGFSPYDSGSIICDIPLGCRPCGLHGGNECPEKHFNCMKELKPEKVYNAAIKILDGETDAHTAY